MKVPLSARQKKSALGLLTDKPAPSAALQLLSDLVRKNHHSQESSSKNKISAQEFSRLE